MQPAIMNYRSLSHTLECLKQQAIDSLPYMQDYIPENISSPEQLFYFLKSITKYKKDPNGIELLQTVPTLMDMGGKGDCDCFTILVLAANKFLGFGPQYVKLVGKSKSNPTHIYSTVYDKVRGKVCAMDLTNSFYCMERPYNNQQILKVNL